MSDPINHPPHYTSNPSGVECITVTEWMNFNLGNAMKYIWRAGEKGNAIQDLQKARWYLDREISRLERTLQGNANVGAETRSEASMVFKTKPMYGMASQTGRGGEGVEG